MATSGTYAYNPLLVDIVIDAFDRIQIRPAAITPDHMLSARRSLNQLFVRFANNQINLWTVDQQTVILNEGQARYSVPGNTISMLETWIRSYQMGALESVPVVCTTTLGSAEVEVTYPGADVEVGYWVTIPIYVSVGGVVLQGNYQVTEVTGASTFKVEASAAASSAVTGGAVPVYATTPSSATVTVALDDHGLVAGDTYTVHARTEVGGLVLQGDYVVQTVPDADTLTITAASEAASADSASENGGEMQIAAQDSAVTPQDRMMMPISRTDYAAIPNKTQTGGYPTSYYFDRTDPPSFYIWLVPDGSIVQELCYYRMTQLQDANPQGDETAQLPYRFQEALCAGLAYMLAVKWLPDAAEALKAYFNEVWQEAMREDRERVTLNIAPQTGSYYQ